MHLFFFLGVWLELILLLALQETVTAWSIHVAKLFEFLHPK